MVQPESDDEAGRPAPAGAPVRCQYCHAPARLVSGETLYPDQPAKHQAQFWHCAACRAWVGCHDGTTKPLGTLADARLRNARIAAHAAFDPLWRGGGLTRARAYLWLAKELGLAEEATHIGQFTIEQCAAVLDAVERRRQLELLGLI